MSLSDALLLDAYREPREVWIVPARSDGAKGTGTQSDPFNASTISYPAISITSLTKNGSGTEATAVTSGNHGFSTGDMITISGVWVESYAKFGDTAYLGTFAITVLSANSFKYALSYPPVTSPAPALASGIQCWREREQFDVIMRGLQPNTTIHLGPGVFETKGVAGDFNIVGWLAQSGQRILGAGMGATTLKIVGASAPYGHYCAIGTRALVEQYLEGFEASDFTIDCNVEGQLIPNTTCAAICFQGGGRHIRIRRVRAIRFGSRAPNDKYIENFVFFFNALNFSAPVLTDCIVEDCVAEQPSPNVYWNSSIFLVGATYDGISKYHRACALRNNYVNGELVYGLRTAVDSIGYSGATGIATIQTKWPHGLTAPGNVSVQGVLVNGSTDNAFNGVFAIEQASGTQVTYKPYAADGPTATGLSTNADTVIGALVSPHFLPVVAIEQVQGFTTKFRITTPIPHNRVVDDVVKISGVVVNGLDSTSPLNKFNGAWKVTAVESKKVLVFELEQQPLSPPYTFSGDMAIGEGHPAFTVDTGTGAVMEGNRVLHCATGGPWHDTGSTRDWVARNNYHYDVLAGPRQIMGHILNFKPCQLTNVNLIATCSLISGTHDLVVGQGVSVQDLAVPPTASEFYGIFTIKSVTPTSFTYEMKSIPSGSAPGSPHFAGVAQVTNCVIENNIIDMAPSRPDYWGRPTAIIKTFLPPELTVSPPFLFRQVVIRENVVRQVLAPPDAEHYGITILSAEKLLVENNTVDVGQPLSIQFSKCGVTVFFSNQGSDGKLIQGYDQVTQQRQSELATVIEDALLLSI